MHSIVEDLKLKNPDRLAIGVIGFDANFIVQVYNRVESEAAGLSPERVLGHHIFNAVAPCMNNYLVAERFVQAAEKEECLDVLIDYVLTLRMRPTPVKLRLLSEPALTLRYILVERRLENSLGD